MMHGREKSDPAIIAVKPTNKAGQSAAEPAEPRAGTEGNASQQSTRRAQNRASVSPALERVGRAAASLDAVVLARVPAWGRKDRPTSRAYARPEYFAPR
jgi:hypothetical protein